MSTRIWFSEKSLGVHVEESAPDIAEKFAAESPKAVALTDKNSGRPIFVNTATVAYWSEVTRKGAEAA
jgi:hypothetical protein